MGPRPGSGSCFTLSLCVALRVETSEWMPVVSGTFPLQVAPPWADLGASRAGRRSTSAVLRHWPPPCTRHLTPDPDLEGLVLNSQARRARLWSCTALGWSPSSPLSTFHIFQMRTAH